MTDLEAAERETDGGCIGDDPTCPCQDGLACHYEGPDAWPIQPPRTPTDAIIDCGFLSLPQEMQDELAAPAVPVVSPELLTTNSIDSELVVVSRSDRDEAVREVAETLAHEWRVVGSDNGGEWSHDNAAEAAVDRLIALGWCPPTRTEENRND